MIHHRTPEFEKIFKKVLAQLKLIFQTQQPVFALTSTGSGGMEALIVNLLNPGDTVIGIDSGKFGERWCEMAEAYGARLIRIKVPWGNPVDVKTVEEQLRLHPETKMVLCQACETSTGVLHPIRKLGERIAQLPNCLFLVDGITAVGALELPMDAWHIDGLVGGSQKAFMLPTGLSFVSLSAKAWKAADTCRQPRFYFDLRKEKQANQKGDSYFSGNVTLIRALSVALDLIFETGYEQWQQQISARADLVREFASLLGLQNISHAPSASISALSINMDSTQFRDHLEQKYQITIMGGQDQLKGKIIRIGHMGWITAADHVRLFESLFSALSEFSLLPESSPEWPQMKIALEKEMARIANNFSS